MQRVQWMQRVIAGLDQRSEILVLHRALVLEIAAAVEAIGHRLVLQIAFAALVADRAVERMVDEQEFHHAVARLLRLGAVGVDHHALGGRHGAGRDGLRRLLLLDEAHAAIAGDGEPLVVAEMRYLDTGALARLEHGGARRHLDLDPVDGELRHHATPPPWRGAHGNAALHLGAEMADEALHRPSRGVAQRAGQGLSNPEIAAQLFLSTKTVEFHLRKVFSKLRISSRVQLPTALANRHERPELT